MCTQIKGVIVVIIKHLLSTQKGQGSDLLGNGRIIWIKFGSLSLYEEAVHVVSKL